jgi:hypothetical protein
MTTLTERSYVADLVKREVEPLISRKLVTLAGGNGVLLRGTVLGTITALGKFKPYDPTQADGSQLTAQGDLAILLDDQVDTTGGDIPNARVIWALGVVDSAFLVWSAGVTTPAHKAAAYAGLAAALLAVLAPA